MQFSEKEIEDLIFTDLEDLNGSSLKRRGFQVIHTGLMEFEDEPPTIRWFRQLDLGAYGRADIVGIYRYRGNVVVELIELKVVNLKSDDIDQICRYETGIVDAINKCFRKKVKIVVNKYLVGTGIDSGHYIANQININIVEFNYDLDGFNFKQHGPINTWHRTDNTITRKKLLQIYNG